MKLHVPLLLPFCLALFSCSDYTEIHKASSVIDAYYATFTENRPGDTESLFSPDFKVKNPPESWVETTQSILNRTGPLKKWERVSKKSHYYPKTLGNQEIVVLIYYTSYQKHQTRELFTLAKDLSTGEYKICGITITTRDEKKDRE